VKSHVWKRGGNLKYEVALKSIDWAKTKKESTEATSWDQAGSCLGGGAEGNGNSRKTKEPEPRTCGKLGRQKTGTDKKGVSMGQKRGTKLKRNRGEEK